VMIPVLVSALLWPGSAEALNGWQDDNDAQPWVVRLRISPGPANASGSSGMCSGTLVSRREPTLGPHGRALHAAKRLYGLERRR
jgi:hypothetical protein